MLTSRIQSSPRPFWAIMIGAIAILFGALTIWSGGQVLFGADAARTAAGNYLPVILWFNFVSGFVYVLAGIELMRWRESSVVLAAVLAIALVLVWIYFGLHIVVGGPYELRTLLAMVLRLSFWVATAVLVFRALRRLPKSPLPEIR